MNNTKKWLVWHLNSIKFPFISPTNLLFGVFLKGMNQQIHPQMLVLGSKRMLT